MRALLLTAATLVLAGCGSPVPAASAGLSVVASTDVYGAVAAAVAGPDVRVTSLINSPDADPHEYESTPADALAVGKATVVVDNGAGYDDFMTKILAASGGKPAIVEVAALSGGNGDVNEHFWYDLPTIVMVADTVAGDLGKADPARAATFTANAKAFDAKVADLQARVTAMKAKHAGAKVAITEPVPLYLVEAAGLVNATPEEFSEAVEKGSDPPAAVLTATLATFTGPDKVKVLLENAQTEGPTTTQAERAAQANGVPVVKVTETLPAGVTDYVTWMGRQIDDLAAALGDTS